MLFLVGFGILVVLFLVFFAIENTLPTVSMEITIFHIVIFLCAGIFGWGALEYISTEWLDLRFREGFWTRAFQVLHTIMFVLIALRGFVIGLVLALFVGVFIFIRWLFLG